MRNIFKVFSVAVAVLAIASCNKVEFKHYSFVTFDSARAMIPEATGIYALPLSLFNTDAAVVTYMVNAGTAKAGVDYVIVDKNGNPNPTGVVSLSSAKDADNFIYIKITDRTGELTKNLTFEIEMVSSATEGVTLGATSKCACTIIDADAGINLLGGDWSGEGVDTNGEPITMSFTISILDPDAESSAEILEAYPDCNLVISDFTPEGMSSQAEIYGFYDDNMSQVHIYGLQPFNRYNFTGLGEYYVGLGTGSWPQNGDDVIFTFADDALEALDDMVIWIIGDDLKVHPQGYYYEDFAAGFTLTMK